MTGKWRSGRCPDERWRPWRRNAGLKECGSPCIPCRVPGLEGVMFHTRGGGISIHLSTGSKCVSGNADTVTEAPSDLLWRSWGNLVAKGGSLSWLETDGCRSGQRPLVSRSSAMEVGISASHHICYRLTKSGGRAAADGADTAAAGAQGSKGSDHDHYHGGAGRRWSLPVQKRRTCQALVL